MKNRTRESCTSGSVRDEDGNILIYSARPHTAMPRTPAAGVRKPPREETAIGEGGAVPRGRYGDLSATAVGANGA